MVRDVLEAYGHEVRIVDNGAAAVTAVHEREPDLLVLDRQMPVMDGLEACRTVKENPFTAHIPVLMLTALSTVDRKLEGYEAGADDYLTKPFDTRELRARVEALLRLVKRETDRNPTSGLPGGRAVEDELRRRVSREEDFAVCYIDLDNFKPFADTFGFAAADAVIRDTGRLLRDAAAESGGGSVGDFVGHIGGDDFIVVTREDRATSLAGAFARRFPEVIASVVGAEVVAAGGFTGPDREGVVRRFPIAKLTTAILIVSPRGWESAARLGERAAALKRQARTEGAGRTLVGRG